MHRFLRFFSGLCVRSRAASYQLAIHMNRSVDPTVLVVGAVAAANHTPFLALVVLTGMAGHG